MIIVDTNVVSEMMRRVPAAEVVEWVRRQPAAALFTTSVTLAEVLYGIGRLPDGDRKELLRATADSVFGAFAGQILPLDTAAAAEYAAVVTARDRIGAPIDGLDAQIAAICRAHEAPLATRNLKDFRDTGVELINPWLGSA